MSTEWPTSPPEPTDLNQTSVTDSLPVRKCIYCDAEINTEDGYFAHVSSCSQQSECLTIRYPNGYFGIVIPESSRYVWTGKTGGFACRNVSIRGGLIPLGHLRKLNLRVEKLGDVSQFSNFDDPEEAYSLYTRGVRASIDHDYGGINLGAKLIAETVDGVYADDDRIRAEKQASRADRITAVWDMIDERLPFEYERVVAPFGKPVTQEGLRWMNVLSSDKEDQFREPWIDALIARDDPVALYYPNSD